MYHVIDVKSCGHGLIIGMAGVSTNVVRDVCTIYIATYQHVYMSSLVSSCESKHNMEGSCTGAGIMRQSKQHFCLKFIVTVQTIQEKRNSSMEVSFGFKY